MGGGVEGDQIGFIDDRPTMARVLVAEQGPHFLSSCFLFIGHALSAYRVGSCFNIHSLLALGG